MSTSSQTFPAMILWTARIRSSLPCTILMKYSSSTNLNPSGLTPSLRTTPSPQRTTKASTTATSTSTSSPRRATKKFSGDQSSSDESSSSSASSGSQGADAAQ